MINFLVSALLILSGVYGTTYAFCPECTKDSDCTGTLYLKEDSSFRCSTFKLPASWLSSIPTCPYDIIINQTDNTANCKSTICPNFWNQYSYSGGIG